MRKRSLGLLFGAMLILTCIGCGAKSMTAKAQEIVLKEATAKTNIVEEPVATAPVPEAKYTFTDMTAVMYAQNTVNVRNLPSTSGNKLGRLSVNDEITVNGQCNETGWYRFDYNGSVAYVSNKYVGANRVEAQATVNNGSGTRHTQKVSFNEEEYYPGQIINKGGTNVYCVMGGDYYLDTQIPECEALVGQNLGIAMKHCGGGTYYWFNGGGYKNGSWDIRHNSNGASGLFFPAYEDANGTYLGQPADTTEN